MAILVTGAKGMLGQDLCPILEDNGYDVIETDLHNLDITDYSACETFLCEKEPELIIHCAAYTNVDGAESDLVTAKRINVKGTENLAKIASKLDIPIAYISTDYVFDGNKNVPYEVFDRPNPINNYGKTKLQGEELVQKYCKKYYIIRTSWLYGHHGKNFVEAMLELAEEKKEIKVVDDQKGSPTWTVDLANGIVDIIENEICGIYHISGKGEATWFDFAKEIFQHKSANVNLISCSTKDFLCVANRPQYSVLNSSIKTRNWKTALKDYLELRIEDMDL